MDMYTRVVSGQRLGKHVPSATDTNATIKELYFLCGPCRGVISKGQGHLVVSSVLESAKKRLEPVGRGTAIVGAVSRKRLVTY
jgi:hypothetical protein